MQRLNSVNCSQKLGSGFVSCGLALILVMGCTYRAASPPPLPAEPAKPTTVSVGRDLFVARCGSCHNERGEKPLRTGLPLNQRKLSREVIAEAVQGRLKDKTEAERQAVIEYISALYVGEDK